MDIAGTNSVGEAAFNVLNSIIGSGIIGLPYALNGAGMVTGILMLVLVGLLSQFATYILVLTGKRTGAMHYSEVARITLGETGYRALSFSLVVSLFGVVTTYLIILGDISSSLRQTYLPAHAWATRSALIAFIAYVLILPLLFFRHAGPLAKWSVVSVAALPVILVLVAVRAPLYSAADEAAEYPVYVGRSLFPALGVLSFSFCSAHAAFQNFLGLRVRTMGNWLRATTIAAWAGIAVSCLFALIGLVSFGSAVRANIFLNFPGTDGYINLARALFCLTLVLTFPLSFYPIRDTLTHVLVPGSRAGTGGRAKETMITLVVLTMVCFTAMGCTDLGRAYELVGAATATTISFIFPALIYLRSETAAGLIADVSASVPLLRAPGGAADAADVQKAANLRRRLGAWLTLGFGVAVFVIGTSTALQR
ncbi:hypothetical protein GGI15_003038 [Coemansia interrupta]|uniref:Amino acid transporter transmembrane domain-containing protein n=1 Tax=Coemansia interrupta TaxID=1126814 RepID=A0A9W8HBV9_9FUNG|nr:hypothetical protein GGI15_003038 [Coemansia interrupta]